jgi:hypothetical protein
VRVRAKQGVTKLVAVVRTRSAAVRMCAALLARIYEVFPLVCPNCKGERRRIAFLTERSSIEAIVTHLGEPILLRPIAPARAARGFPTDADRPFRQDIGAEPVPAIDFDQRHGW